MSEMQKSCELKITVNKPTGKFMNRYKERTKNQIKTLNGVKTVSIKNLTDSTKSGERSSARQNLSFKKKVTSSDSNPKLKIDLGGAKLNSSGNNNSISSLKLDGKNFLIDLGNQSKAEPFYSPLARDRSHTITSAKEAVFHKCKSSKSISSNGKGNGSKLKVSPNLFPNTPFKNIKLSTRKYDVPKTTYS